MFLARVWAFVLFVHLGLRLMPFEELYFLELHLEHHYVAAAALASPLGFGLPAPIVLQLLQALADFVPLFLGGFLQEDGVGEKELAPSLRQLLFEPDGHVGLSALWLPDVSGDVPLYGGLSTQGPGDVCLVLRPLRLATPILDYDQRPHPNLEAVLPPSVGRALWLLDRLVARPIWD